MIAERWFADQPDRTSVVRTEDGIAGFAYHIFCPTGSTMEDRDPVVRAILGYVARTAPARPGERVDITRFVAGARGSSGTCTPCWPDRSPRSSTWCTEPLAWSFRPSPTRSTGRPFFDYLGFRAVLEVDEAVGRPPLVYGTTGGASRSTPGSS